MANNLALSNMVITLLWSWKQGNKGTCYSYSRVTLDELSFLTSEILRCWDLHCTTFWRSNLQNKVVLGCQENICKSSQYWIYLKGVKRVHVLLAYSDLASLQQACEWISGTMTVSGCVGTPPPHTFYIQYRMFSFSVAYSKLIWWDSHYSKLDIGGLSFKSNQITRHLMGSIWISMFNSFYSAKKPIRGKNSTIIPIYAVQQSELGNTWNHWIIWMKQNRLLRPKMLPWTTHLWVHRSTNETASFIPYSCWTRGVVVYLLFLLTTELWYSIPFCMTCRQV